MSPQDFLLDHLVRQKNRIGRLLRPGATNKSTSLTESTFSPIDSGFGGNKFLVAADKMRFLRQEKLGLSTHSMASNLSTKLSEKIKSFQQILHFANSTSGGKSPWDEISKVFPSQKNNIYEPQLRSDEIGQGSIIQKFNSLPQNGQSLQSFKEQVASRPTVRPVTAKAEKKAQLAPKDRLFTRVQEISDRSQSKSEPSTSNSTPQVGNSPTSTEPKIQRQPDSMETRLEEQKTSSVFNEKNINQPDSEHIHNLNTSPVIDPKNRHTDAPLVDNVKPIVKETEKLTTKQPLTRPLAQPTSKLKNNKPLLEQAKKVEKTHIQPVSQIFNTNKPADRILSRQTESESPERETNTGFVSENHPTDLETNQSQKISAPDSIETTSNSINNFQDSTQTQPAESSQKNSLPQDNAPPTSSLIKNIFSFEKTNNNFPLKQFLERKAQGLVSQNLNNAKNKPETVLHSKPTQAKNMIHSAPKDNLSEAVKTKLPTYDISKESVSQFPTNSPSVSSFGDDLILAKQNNRVDARITESQISNSKSEQITPASLISKFNAVKSKDQNIVEPKQLSVSLPQNTTPTPILGSQSFTPSPTVLTPARAANTVQRLWSEHDESGGNTGQSNNDPQDSASSTSDIENLAEKVLPIIKQLLELELERTGSRFSR